MINQCTRNTVVSEDGLSDNLPQMAKCKYRCRIPTIIDVLYLINILYYLFDVYLPMLFKYHIVHNPGDVF